jgi:DNA-binding transcriptional LysR family regulator
MAFMQLRRLNLNDLLALDALLSERHVTRAAARSGLSQSAMSHTLRRLREQLGDPLLVRGANGLLPTPRGLELATRLRQALAELEQTLFDVPAFDPATSDRTFTVACIDLVTLPLLPPVLAIIAAEAPGLRIVVRPLRADRLVDELERDELDVALVGSEATPGMRRQHVYSEDFVCIVREGHPALRRRWNRDRYRALPHIMISPHGEDETALERTLAKHGVRLPVVLRVPYFVVGPIMVALSNLALTAPRRLAAGMATDFPLRLLELPVSIPGVEIAQVWHPKNDRDPALSWLRDSIVAAFAQSVILTSKPPPPRRHRRPMAPPPGRGR